jgi:zinc transporter 1/2/3
MTPLGILVGTLMTSEITMQGGRYLSPAFLALAAGTFLYIGSVHMFERPYFKSSVNYLSSFWSTLAGIGLMAVVAIWL